MLPGPAERSRLKERSVLPKGHFAIILVFDAVRIDGVARIIRVLLDPGTSIRPCPVGAIS